ncbi:Na+/H+ antiporter NhaA [Leucobacter tardus]|uniref:Na(+)/H(+) antiporter NhaA n=1 Tax=Leucobacter tardus TaxID=501483 RepID=A0A939QDQ9_9MICO|nr:Na+/H+ antiporter NhaA [Leucobacter tardus]MBO2990275.1 Na+/H+ antiporter NhaA [Leucobacter tardus]
MQNARPARGLARLTRWLRTESGSALLLVCVTAVALVWANSPASAAYVDLWHAGVGFDLGPFGLHMDLHHWVNDGLMVIFFFVIGLEVRQEFAHGSLRDRSRTRLAVIAGVAGVALPAVIYVLVVGASGGEGLSGWGAVVGTDTAFMLGALAVVGPRLSGQLRVFLLTLTVVDDFLAVSIIGFVYSEQIRLVPILIALACLFGLWLLGRARQWHAAPYVVLVVVLWIATLESGVHASLAGMLAGLLIPSFATQRQKVVAAKALFRDFWQSPSAASARAMDRGLARGISVNERLHEVLRMPTALIVVPVFALANAGVDLRGGLLGEAFASPVTWGVIIGLVVGKLLGIGVVTLIAVRLGFGRLPDGVGQGSVVGGAALSGIGFTVSLLIIGLAFGSTSDLGREATVGVLVSMVVATALGWVIFRVAARRWGEETADLPMVLDPPVDPEVDHIRGPEDAQLTLVEYIDFECPFCAHTTGSWADLQRHFGDDLRYVVRHLPLESVHPHALLAAHAAEAAARQNRFWDWHDYVFPRQDALELQDLVRYAEELGLDAVQFIDDLERADVAARVERDAVGADASGARGTPTFFVDGRRHLGSFDARTLISALEQRRRGARTQEADRLH